MKKRYTEEQIIGFLNEADGDVPGKEPCRKHGFSVPSYCASRSKLGRMEMPDANKPQAVEIDNAKLRRLVAEVMLQNDVT